MSTAMGDECDDSVQSIIRLTPEPGLWFLKFGMTGICVTTDDLRKLKTELVDFFAEEATP